MAENFTEQKTDFSNLINPYTNKPVQTGNSISFNQKVYNDTTPLQARYNSLDNYRNRMSSPSVNQQALYNIPVVPDVMQDEYNEAYQAANWLNSLNIASPDEIDEWRAKGKMGIAETAQRLKSLKSAKYAPFVGTTAEVGYNLDMLSAVNRLKKGQKISELEQDLLVDYLRELKEIQVRGTTLPSKALSAILESLPYFAEFGIGVAAAPETFGGSLSVSALALTKAAGKKAARKAVEKALKNAATESVMTGTKKAVSLSAAKSLYKNTYNEMLKAGAVKATKEVGAKEAAKIVAKTTPQNIVAANFGSKPLTYMTAKNTIGGFADRQLAGSMQVTDAGEAVFLEPENMALSIMKSFGSAIFDNYTETMGWAFAPVSSYFAKPIRNILPKKFFTEFEKLVSSRYGMKAADALKKYGYDGVVEEMGEELLNRFLCDVFGIQGLEGYTFDGFMNNVFYANEPEQWLVEALSFAAMGGAAHGVHGSYSKIREELEKQGNEKALARLTELANKRIYSPAEFYLEQGLIKIDGSQSAAEQMLREKFAENGIDKNAADDYFKTASELEIREKLKEFINEEAQDTEKRREKAVEFLADRMLENNSYKNRDLAEKNANLFVTALEKFSETNGIAIDDLIREEAPTIRNQVEEAAPEAEQKRVIDERLSELEQEFENLSYGENFDENKFNELETEYDNLVNLKNQGEVYYQEAIHAGAEDGEYLDAAKEWKEKGTDSQYFKRWFGDSKVVDEDGKPLVVYHGSLWKFDTFGKSDEFDFSFSPKFAYEYAAQKSFEQALDLSPVLYSVYLKAENPFDFRDEKSVNELLKKIGDKEINFWGNKYSHEQFKDLIMGLSYENTVKNQEVFDKAEVGMAYSRYNEDVEEKMSSVADAKIVYKNKDYFVALDEIDEPRRSPFSSEPTGRVDRDDVYKQVEKLAKDIDFADEHIKKITLNTNLVKTTYEVGKGYVDEYTPYELTVRLRKVDNPKIAKKGAGYDNWSFFEATKIGDTYFLDFLKENGYDSYYKQEKEQLNISVFNPEQIKSVDNRGTFDANNLNIYYQSAYHGTPHRFEEFSTENIGSGEGAQAHGWGLYFAENREVSESYKKDLENITITYKGKPIEDYISDEYFGKTRHYAFLLADGEAIKENIKDDYEADIEALEYEKRLYTDVEFRKKENIRLQKKLKKASKGQPYLLYKNNADWKDANEKLALIEDVINYSEHARYQIGNLEERIEHAKNDLKFLLNINVSKLKKEGEGQLFKVDIPDVDIMLDEDKNYREQPDKVRKAIIKLAHDEKIPISYFANASGKEIYERIGKFISMKIGRAEKTSKLLNKYGIKGITYDGRLDGRCYVVFDDKAVKVLEKYYQGEDDAIQGNMLFDNEKARELRKVKGSYIPAENLIELFKNADESTVVHEFAHWWLDRLVKYSQKNEELAADVEAIRNFVKNDGEPFTREQHEKFARGFEAYIRSGYAKTNRLKRIFEDFKNALLAIYDSIKQLGFKDDDMPQIQGLFDRLLTTEKERIKTTIFDKVAEIDEKIAAIKDNEAKEFAELDEIYKDNINLLNRKSDKKRKVQEYLELADKMTSRETKEVKEFKKRFKDATFAILERATGYKRQFIANPRNWEKVQEAFEGTDRITASDGMLAEWREFYTDTGVSYDNDEIDGDDKLAQQAYDVMVDGTYSRTFNENYGFEEIDKFMAKFDYLHAKVKTLKGEEKAAAFEALCTLFDNFPTMPDEAASSIFEKLEEIGQEYEELQKNDFNKKSYPSIPVVQQLQYYITNKLNQLKIYNPETRYKMRLNKSHRLYKYIQGVTSVDAAKKQIRRINEFVIDDMRNNQRSLLHKEIQKQIHVNSKTVKVGTLTKGKFDWKTNTVFSELVQMNKLSREDAEAQLGNIVQIQDAVKSEARDSYDENETGEFNKSNDFQDNLKKKFLQYRSMKLQELDVTHTIQLLQDILELKEKGRQAKSEEDFINKTQRWNTKNNLLDILEVTKTSGAKFGANWVAGVGKAVSLNGGTLANWESLLNAVFDKDTSRKYSLLQDEAQSEIYARKHMKYFYDRAAQIYGFKQANNWDRFLDFDYMQPMIKLFQEYADEKYNYTQSVFSINSPEGIAKSNIEISRAQMITMFAWSLNEKLEQRLFTQFGLNQIRDMFENVLSKEDRELAWALVDTCERMREDINDVFIRTTGLSLPAVENYFPSKAERVQSDIDMYHDFFVKSSSPSFIKERKTCNRIPMKPLAPLEILIPHINKTAKYVVMSEKVNFLNQIFKDTAIKTKMQEIWGSKDGADIYQTLINKLAASTFTNYSKGTNLVAGALDTLSRNYITSSIGFSPKVALGQLLSVINYAENMPAHIWAKGFKDTLKHPIENFKYMLENCEYLQTRLAGNSQNEVMAILTSEKDKFRTLRNFMTSNVKWGDILAITLGGKPYVDYLMQQGMSKEEAFNKFVEDTMRAQQAGTTSSISEWQSAQAKNCLTRMFFAFRNTDMQYERKFIDTVIQAKKGEIGKKEAIKKLFIYKIFNPFMFTSFLQNLSLVALFRAIFDDDTDEAIAGFLKSAVEAVMLSGMTAYGFAGFIAKSFMESLVAHFDKEYKHFETDVPVMSDFDMQAQKFIKGDLEFADYVEALATGSEFALGVPSTKVVNALGGIGDVAQGNVGVGLSRMAGWGRYTSTKAWTGKEPEKKKKKRK